MSKLSRSKLEELQKVLNESDEYFSRASQIWNALGVDNPPLIRAAAQSALDGYQKSADLLDVDTLSILPIGLKNRFLANKEQALAQVATMQMYLCNHQDNDSLEVRLGYAQEAVRHLGDAIKYLEMSDPSDPELLFKLRNDLLHNQGLNANLLARLTASASEINEAIQFYALAEAKFFELMKEYETKSPELALIRARIEKSLDRDWNSDNVQDIDGIQCTMLIMRTDEPFMLLSNEDLYRRAASNFYSSTASRYNAEAYQILQNGVALEDAENKLTGSINFTYYAMEAFPTNLEFHRDLIDVWRAKGKVFGCPFVETENHFHTRCPIAIKHFIGKWYVSPTLEYDSLTCTVCGKDIFECSHYPGQKIEEIIVRYQRQNPRISSISLVDIPEDPGCRIEWISIPKNYFPPTPNRNDQWRCYICQHEDIT